MVNYSSNIYRTNFRSGFTLIEMLIVVAIIGILAAIGYPNYRQYVINTNRVDAMTEMQNIASEIESQKMKRGSYAAVDITDKKGSFPRSGSVTYTITVTDPITTDWVITATPSVTGSNKDDKVLTLNSRGVKCRDSACGLKDEWR